MCDPQHRRLEVLALVAGKGADGQREQLLEVRHQQVVVQRTKTQHSISAMEALGTLATISENCPASTNRTIELLIGIEHVVPHNSLSAA